MFLGCQNISIYTPFNKHGSAQSPGIHVTKMFLLFKMCFGVCKLMIKVSGIQSPKRESERLGVRVRGLSGDEVQCCDGGCVIQKH